MDVTEIRYINPLHPPDMVAGVGFGGVGKKFDREMREIYVTAKRDCGYNATRFLQLVGDKGGLNAAKQLISKPGGTDGFATLWEHRRLDLSVEAHVLKPEYEPLFTEEERRMCRERLIEFGYTPSN